MLIINYLYVIVILDQVFKAKSKPIKTNINRNPLILNIRLKGFSNGVIGFMI